jgi:hypothetical protein
MVIDGTRLTSFDSSEADFHQWNPVDLDNKQKRVYEKYPNRPSENSYFAANSRLPPRLHRSALSSLYDRYAGAISHRVADPANSDLGGLSRRIR